VLMNGAVIVQNTWRVNTEEDFTSPWANSTMTLWVEMLNFGAVVAVAFFLQAALKRNISQNMSMGKTTNELKASTELLRLTCDAVVELDENLCFVAHSPALAGMLLRTRPGYTLEGVCFTDLIATPEEAERAVEILNSTQATAEMDGTAEASANAFHTRLTDSCSSTFRTEVFRVRLATLDGRRRHLIGLRDFTDDQALANDAIDAQASSATSSAGGGVTPLSPLLGIPGHTLASAARRSVRNSSPENGGGSGSGTDDDSRTQAAHLELDLISETVLSASMAVQGMEGQGFGQVFHEEGVKVMRQVWMDVQELEKKGELAGKTIRIGDLQVRKPSGIPLQVWANVEVLRGRGGERRLLLCFKVPLEKKSSRRSGRGRSGSQLGLTGPSKTQRKRQPEIVSV
ncbi:rsmI, partial [Symbiodinium pilosum]